LGHSSRSPRHCTFPLPDRIKSAHPEQLYNWINTELINVAIVAIKPGQLPI